MPEVDLPNNLEQLNLSQAAQYVIDQNTEIGYTPTEFLNIVNRGNANNDLNVRISNLVLDIKLLERLEPLIRQYPNLVTIEDLITNKEDKFGLSGEVAKQAQARTERFNQIRFNN